MIEVCIVDDQRLMREGLRTLLNLEPDIRVVGLAANGEEAIAFLKGRLVGARPAHEGPSVDVVLMDIRMPVRNGIEATRFIKQRWPQVKVLMLTTYEDRDDVVGALSAGAVGYLLKDMPGEEIATAIRTVQTGGGVLPPGIANTFLSAVQEQSHVGSENGRVSDARTGDHAELSRVSDSRSQDSAHLNDVGLTERETDVLHCLAEGLSNREIAARLYVTEGTVKNHVSSIIAKLELRDRTQAALYAVRHGYGAYEDKV